MKYDGWQLDDNGQCWRWTKKQAPMGLTSDLSDVKRKVIGKKILFISGCTGISCTSDETQLNSRTINIVLETNPYTCMLHRQVRDVERSYIQKIKRQRRAVPVYSMQHTCTPNNSMTYEFTSESEPEVIITCTCNTHVVKFPKLLVNLKPLFLKLCHITI